MARLIHIVDLTSSPRQPLEVIDGLDPYYTTELSTP
jgi:hypothetical protein